MQQQQNNRPNWEMIIPLLTVIVLTLGPTIALHMHLSSQVNAQMIGIREEITAIHQEMKDFHGRLCAIEERNKAEK